MKTFLREFMNDMRKSPVVQINNMLELHVNSYYEKDNAKQVPNKGDSLLLTSCLQHASPSLITYFYYVLLCFDIFFNI
jgi:hypothetical protein